MKQEILSHFCKNSVLKKKKVPAHSFNATTNEPKLSKVIESRFHTTTANYLWPWAGITSGR